MDFKEELSQWMTPEYVAKEVARQAKRWSLGIGSFTTTILEPACGTGNISKQLAEVGFRVVGLDIDSRFDPLGIGVDALAQSADIYWMSATQVAMNPPFEGGKDKAFLLKAVQFVKKGHAITSVMSARTLSNKWFRELMNSGRVELVEVSFMGRVKFEGPESIMFRNVSPKTDFIVLTLRVGKLQSNVTTTPIVNFK